MFNKNTKVVYPRHGAGRIVDKYEIEIEGKEKKYLKIEFYNSSITISIPMENAKELGLRKPLTKGALRKELKKLGNTVSITDSTLKNLDKIAKEKFISGKVEDTISIVNTLQSLARQKERESKNFSYTASERLEAALEFLKSETELVLGKKALNHYNLL